MCRYRQPLDAGHARAELKDPQLSTDCLKPNHSRSRALEVFRASFYVSVGSDHRSSEIRRTYTEERDQISEEFYAGDDVGSMAVTLVRYFVDQEGRF